MIDAWIVVREERHIEDRFWICLNKKDALKIANEVAEYWKDEYQIDNDDADRELYEDMLFNYSDEDRFRVYVKPQQIREAGETAQGESMR